MKRYLVQSGELSEIVDAPDEKAAFEIALKQAIRESEADSAPWPKLGQLMSSIEVAPDADWAFKSTETVCREARLWETLAS
jgi:hypothetical protein